MSRAGLRRSTLMNRRFRRLKTAKIDGLRRFYGVTDERGLAFFTVHEKADLWHARTGAELIARHCNGDNDRKLAVDAGDSALGALWSMLDAC
jgi:pyrroloquinoline-quinone synthase